MKKLIYLLILSLAFVLTGCTNGPLEIVEIKHRDQTYPVFSSEGFDKLDKNQIDTYMKSEDDFEIKFNQRVNECEITIYLLDDSLNIHEVHEFFDTYARTIVPDISWNKIKTKLPLTTPFIVVDSFDYYNDKYYGMEIKVNGKTFYTAFKALHRGLY